MTQNAERSLEEVAVAALAKVKSAYKNGNTGLSRALADAGLPAPTPQAISQWTIVPVERVNDVEQVSGISRQLLRGDIFGLPDDVSLIDALFAEAVSEPSAV